VLFSFAADTDCPTATTSGVASAPSTKIPAVTVAAGAGPVLDFRLNGSFRTDKSAATNAVCYWELYDGTNSYPLNAHGIATASGTLASITPTLGTRVVLTSPLQTAKTYELRYGANAAGGSCTIENDFVGINSFEIAVTSYPQSSVSTYSSTNADYGATAFTPVSTWTANSTHTGVQWRTGEYLNVRGQITLTGAPTSATLKMTVPLGLSIDTSKIGSPSLGEVPLGFAEYLDLSTNNYQGPITYDSATSVYFYYNTASATNVTWGTANATNPFTFGSGDKVYYEYKVPIVGWDQSNIIIAQLNGLESCADSYECTPSFSAKVSNAGVVSDENLDFINGNCTLTSTNHFVCPYKTGLVGSGVSLTNKMNCIVKENAIPQTTIFTVHEDLTLSSSSQFVYDTYSGATTQSADARAVTINCDKVAADYVPKTAKAVASDQNTRQPGLTGSKIRTAVLNCDASSSITSQKGTSWISTISNIDGNGNCSVTLVANSFTALPDCQMTRYASGGFSVGLIVGGGAQSSSVILLDAEDDTGATATSYDVTLDCSGE